MRISWLAIRWRLTLWYTLLLGVIIVLFSVGIVVGLQRALYNGLDDGLRNQATLTISTMQVEDGAPHIDLTEESIPKEDEQFIRVTDRNGLIVADTSDRDHRIRDQKGLERALKDHTVLNWVQLEEGRVRVLSEPITEDDVVVSVVQVGQRDEHVVETVRTTVRLIAILVPITLLLALTTGGWLARRALLPLRRIANLAGEIEAQDLSRRIELELPDDEIGQLARTFNAMLDRIELAFRRQRHFTADAAHELRTPLALMQSQIELALTEPRDPAGDTAVFMALTEDVDRLSRISTALLSLARGDAEHIHLDYDEIDVAALLALMSEHYAAVGDERGIAIVLDTRPTSILADEDRLIQILGNLLDNALRYVSDGGQVTLGCRIVENMARIWVADTGSGIGEEHLSHIFDRFYRTEQGRARSHGGAGLGLTISKMLVEAHRGSISATSTPGICTTITLELPVNGPNGLTM